MSFQGANEWMFSMICKVTPRGQMCRNHLMAKYPECFKSKKSFLRYVWETPQWIWTRLFKLKAAPIKDLSVCPICQEEEYETAFLINGFKILFLLAAAVAILFGLIKAVASRRATTPLVVVAD